MDAEQIATGHSLLAGVHSTDAQLGRWPWDVYLVGNP
jgi:hypothetical protein